MPLELVGGLARCLEHQEREGTFPVGEADDAGRKQRQCVLTWPGEHIDHTGIGVRRVDAQVARAQSLETTNRAAAAGAWHTADRMLTDDAPWVPMKVFLSTDFVARRVGNYKYCWLSATSGLTGACLDQLWVR